MFEKELYIRFFLLFVAPKRAWSRIASDDPVKDAALEFVFPFVAICVAGVTVAGLMHSGWDRATLSSILIDAVGWCVSLFGGFYLVSFLVNKLGRLLLKRADEWQFSQQLAGYSLAPCFLLTIIASFFPVFFQGLSPVRLMSMCYTFYIIWHGADKLMGVEGFIRVKYTLWAGIFIVAVPESLRLFFNLMTYYTF